jgi:hypothetical protein
MAEKQRLDQAQGMALPPIRLGMGDVLVPDPDWQHKAGQNQQKRDPVIKSTVIRLIAHFKDEK